MTECFIIPDGEQNAYFRQFGRLNRIEPIQLKDGNWILPVRVLTMLQKTYVDLKKPIESDRRIARKDVTDAVLNFAESTIIELERFPKRQVSPDDVHDRYKKLPKENEIINPEGFQNI